MKRSEDTYTTPFENRYVLWKSIFAMGFTVIVMGFIGFLCLADGSVGENRSNLTIQSIQNTSSFLTSASPMNLIQPVLLAPIKVVGESIFIVWPDNRTMVSTNQNTANPVPTRMADANWDIFFVRSPDRGKTFTDPINLSKSINGTSLGPEIAVFEGNSNSSIYITFWDNKTGENSPYFVYSTNNGVTFSTPIMLNVTMEQ
jgi:hypothetical protein